MNITEQDIIGKLVAEDYRTATVFRKYGVDFCCNGNRTILDASQQKNIDASMLLSELEGAIRTDTNNSTDYNEWPIDLLADYIEKKHHRYVDAKSIEIKAYLDKIVSVHGERHPELLQIRELFSKSAGELAVHMKKEEFILFPFIRKMVKTKEKGELLTVPKFGTVENPIEMMKEDHDHEGERFREIELLSNKYQAPTDACNTYRVAFALLQEFEADLHLHIHLENNILFPKAIEMERELTVADKAAKGRLVQP